MMTLGVSGQTGDTVEVVVSARNTLPVHQFMIPVVFAGDVDLQYVDYSTEGCRTEYFEEQDRLAYDASSRYAVFQLISSTARTSPDLESGQGPILKIRFEILGATQVGDSTPIVLSPVGSYEPVFYTERLDFEPRLVAGAVVYQTSCCDIRGDIDDSGDAPDVSDLVYLVNYMFKQGPQPPCLEEADVNGDGGTINIGDLVYLVNYMFKEGPDPVPCP
jgi:hypothetical protein